MIWFFERQNSRLRYEIRRQVDGHDYELVITRPDGHQDMERYADPSALMHRTQSLERALREEGWQVPMPLRSSRVEGRGPAMQSGH